LARDLLVDFALPDLVPATDFALPAFALPTDFAFPDFAVPAFAFPSTPAAQPPLDPQLARAGTFIRAPATIAAGTNANTDLIY
jgi:hypothetical protein